MTRFAILCVSTLALIAPAQAFAEEAAVNRYTMEKTETGFVRLDTRTGEMSICTEQGGQLVCRLAADERRALEEILADLSARVDALEQHLEGPLPMDKSTDIPDEAEIDRALGAMEKLMRSFSGMVDEFRRDFEDRPESPLQPLPDRT